MITMRGFLKSNKKLIIIIIILLFVLLSSILFYLFNNKNTEKINIENIGSVEVPIDCKYDYPNGLLSVYNKNNETVIREILISDNTTEYIIFNDEFYNDRFTI